MKYKFLLSPWKNEFTNTIGKTKKELFISSPFVNMEGVRILLHSIPIKSSIKISLVTNLTTENIINRAIEPKALLELYKQFTQVRISSLSKLHAKTYLIDNKVGVITSANLTGGGLANNFEYGVLINDKAVVSIMKEDMSQYYSLGNIFDGDLLEKISKEANNLQKIKDRTQDIIKDTKLAKLIEKSKNILDFELLRNRVKKGRTINIIFSDTILYLLKKKGALSTEEIHSLIQAIHSDICDDSIDRIINGQHFGKKWKHSVRNAQQSLRKKGLIYLKGKKWRLTS